jgi:hypothetical protein
VPNSQGARPDAVGIPSALSCAAMLRSAQPSAACWKMRCTTGIVTGLSTSLDFASSAHWYP